MQEEGCSVTGRVLVERHGGPVCWVGRRHQAGGPVLPAAVQPPHCAHPQLPVAQIHVSNLTQLRQAPQVQQLRQKVYQGDSLPYVQRRHSSSSMSMQCLLHRQHDSNGCASASAAFRSSCTDEVQLGFHDCRQSCFRQHWRRHTCSWHRQLQCADRGAWPCVWVQEGVEGAPPNAQLLLVPHGLQRLYHPDFWTCLCQWHTD